MSVARVGCTESVHPCLTRGTETVHVAENGWVTVRKKLGFWRGSPLSGRGRRTPRGREVQ